MAVGSRRPPPAGRAGYCRGWPRLGGQLPFFLYQIRNVARVPAFKKTHNLSFLNIFSCSFWVFDSFPLFLTNLCWLSLLSPSCKEFSSFLDFVAGGSLPARPLYLTWSNVWPWMHHAWLGVICEVFAEP